MVNPPCRSAGVVSVASTVSLRFGSRWAATSVAEIYSREAICFPSNKRKGKQPVWILDCVHDNRCTDAVALDGKSLAETDPARPCERPGRQGDRVAVNRLRLVMQRLYIGA